jgi:hypothetical protein
MVSIPAAYGTYIKQQARAGLLSEIYKCIYYTREYMFCCLGPRRCLCRFRGHDLGALVRQCL